MFELISERPFDEFRKQCEDVLRRALEHTFPDFMPESIKFAVPPKPELGDLGSSTPFELAGRVKADAGAVSSEIVKRIDLKDAFLVDSAFSVGGYINFKIKFPDFASTTLESVKKFKDFYGFVKEDKELRIIVEHTSVNPIHPIHIGQARNPILGDSIARILSARGHRVYRHYYVDDVGRQSSIIAYGYDKLGRPEAEGKADHMIGAIYAVTSCLIELSRLNAIVKKGVAEERLRSQLEEWKEVAKDLKKRYPDLFERLERELSKVEDPEAEIRSLMKRYELGEEEAKHLIRKVADLCLEGFKQTLSRLNIAFDSWDWESDFVWNSSVKKVVEKLRETPYVFLEDEALKFDAEKTARDFKVKEKLQDKSEIPPLTLLRGDGTTLYTTRDIAYSIWKLSKADLVINVVGMEQKLPQLQLKLALYALGLGDKAENLIHYGYNLVRLPGYRMSSRRGRYVTLDEVMDESVERAFEEVSKRSPQLSTEERRQIAEVVGIGAIRFAFVSVDPSKPVVFTWDRVLNFERNSSPYIQYTYARAGSILRKAPVKTEVFRSELLTKPIERELVVAVSKFPEVVIEASENLKPNTIAEYLVSLSDAFNSFYNSTPVIKAGSEDLVTARLTLVEGVRTVIKNGLNLLGIEAPERM
ncbi:arginine--tRNA ligase [Candidatus Bathyarchaeota archaeon]|nr:MAG: arginine--tRNA ligase [Candidatus Bathyarchaeota archaeon]